MPKRLPTLHEINYADEGDALEVLNDIHPDGINVTPHGGGSVVTTVEIDPSIGFDMPEGYEISDDLVEEAIEELEGIYDEVVQQLKRDG